MPSREETPSAALLDQLKTIVGARSVLTKPQDTKPYRTGFRFGGGDAMAVVLPGSLVEMWRVLSLCSAADTAIIMQAANTGLTGGSTPDGDDYDRDVVIVNPMRIDAVHLLGGGSQLVCLPGATLHQLEALLTPLGREPHSVIGSSCIGASVVGGICNNSGGALIQRGPAYTKYALYAQRDADGELRLVNHLGIELPEEPEAMLTALEAGAFDAGSIREEDRHAACDHDYVRRVREIDAPTPARFNADPERLHEASGCAGKLAIFAVRLNSFPKHKRTQVFYIGTNRPDELTRIRRDILGTLAHLPVAGEYLHRTCFDIAETYGKDTFLAIERLGTDRLPQLFRAKARIDGIATRLGFRPGFSDRWMQRLSRLFPSPVPPRMKVFRDRYEHHLILRMADDGIDEAARYLAGFFPSSEGDFFACDEREGERAFLLRFAAAGAAVRYRIIHSGSVEDIVALDVALPRNARDWVERLPDCLAEKTVATLYYGHFFCHVFHQDYILRKGHDPLAFEHDIWRELDERDAKYPAEHNVGHLYHADEGMLDFYRSLDPTNSFNPGIGQSSRLRDWKVTGPQEDVTRRCVHPTQ
jgi:D-lactate dehydrogenase